MKIFYAKISHVLWENTMKVHLKRNRAQECVLDSADSGYGSVACSCEHGNETYGSIKHGYFFSPLGQL
jgi:hypothetical protein